MAQAEIASSVAVSWSLALCVFDIFTIVHLPQLLFVAAEATLCLHLVKQTQLVVPVLKDLGHSYCGRQQPWARIRRFNRCWAYTSCSSYQAATETSCEDYRTSPRLTLVYCLQKVCAEKTSRSILSKTALTQPVCGEATC